MGVECRAHAFVDRRSLFRGTREGDALNVLSHGAGRRGHQPLDARTRRMGLVIGIEH